MVSFLRFPTRFQRHRSPGHGILSPIPAYAMAVLGLVLPLMVLPCAAGATIYKWTDANGVVHFSDTPAEGAKKVDVPPAPVYSAPKLPVPAAAQPAKPTKSAAKSSYSDIAVVQPTSKETIWSGSGDVEVAVSVTPDLRPHDKVQFFLDGQPQGAPSSSIQTHFPDVSRGTHQVSAEVVNPDGKVLVRSDSVTFYLHRPSILFHKGK